MKTTVGWFPLCYLGDLVLCLLTCLISFLWLPLWRQGTHAGIIWYEWIYFDKRGCWPVLGFCLCTREFWRSDILKFHSICFTVHEFVTSDCALQDRRANLYLLRRRKSSKVCYSVVSYLSILSLFHSEPSVRDGVNIFVETFHHMAFFSWKSPWA